MTIVAAIKKDNEIWIGADKICTDGSITYSVSKLITVLPGVIIGIAGQLSFVSLFRNSLKNVSGTISSHDDVYELMQYLKRQINQSGCGKPVDDSLPLHEFSLLIATSKHLYTCEGDYAIIEHSKYVGIGCGRDYAMGALQALYNTKHRPREILKRSLLVVCKLALQCGEGIELIKINKGKK